MSSVFAADIGSYRYFLPHHCVIKEDSSTTKLRVVLLDRRPVPQAILLTMFLWQAL